MYAFVVKNLIFNKQYWCINW